MGIRKRRDPSDAPRPETKKNPPTQKNELETKKSTIYRRNRPDPGRGRNTNDEAESQPFSQHDYRHHRAHKGRRARESEGIRKGRDPGDAPRPETKKSTSNRRNRPDPVRNRNDEAE